ncbi:MAG: CHAT domain-containing protein, partial [Bacteroidota bacterium]
EVISIDSISKNAGLKSSVYTDNEPEESFVVQKTESISPDIIHFATHGLQLEQVKDSSRSQFIESSSPLEKSAILLAGSNNTITKIKTIKNNRTDGVLTAKEVLGLDLKNTKLVVLSACRTGLGKQFSMEGVFGLQRSFKIAGVEKVISSLWDVNDEAANYLQVAFYKQLLNYNLYPNQALRNAKLQLLKEGYEPSDWASFILLE